MICQQCCRHVNKKEEILTDPANGRRFVRETCNDCGKLIGDTLVAESEKEAA